MNQEILFRMNFILQDNSATTTKTYLAKIIETLLFEQEEPISVSEIARIIKDSYYLEFTSEEILKALNNHKSRHFVQVNDKFALTPEYANKLSKAESIDSLLNKYINQAIIEQNIDMKPNELHDLITRYIYFCFNSNQKILLALMDGVALDDTGTFKANNDEISAINKFIMWNNSSKNKFIFNIISYCYIYCSLNVKKDSLLSKKLFKNKQFCLDANIIFRLAGLNNDDRQNTILSFIDKCNEVGIKLIYTNVTLDELYRVINSKVTEIKSITHSSAPLEIDIESYGNDFYNIYNSWCKKPQNKFDDFTSFQNYLIGQIECVISNLEYRDITNYSINKNSNFNECFSSLKLHKEKNTRKSPSFASLQADVSNVLYIIDERSTHESSNIFSTNDYLISADQYLISWTQKFAGVPIVVLPSIWLTIILRFCGRTDNDYLAFCSFMSLRSHNEPNEIDIFSLIKELGFHTDNKKLKERIISEIIGHKNEYISTDTNYTDVIVKAFDNIQSQDDLEHQDYFDRTLKTKEAKLLKEKEEALALSQEETSRKHLNSLVNRDFKRSTAIPYFVNKIKMPLAYFTALILVATAILWFFNIEPIYSIYEFLFPNRCNSFDYKCTAIAVVWFIIVLLARATNRYLNYCSSSKYIEKKKNKLTNKYIKILEIK